MLLTAWTLLAMAANRAIFTGIWYPSLQELSGLCFVGLGLLARRRPWLLVVCWIVAAWFKSPFAWLLLGYGVLLIRRRDTRVAGALAIAAATPTLVVAALLARVGHYTNDVASIAPAVLRAHVDSALGLLGPPALVLLAGAIALRSRIHRYPDPLPLALLIGGAAYLANMTPWRTDAYYAGPYLYLLTLGALLILRDVQVPAGRIPLKTLGLLAVPLLVAIEVAGSSLLDGWYTNANVTGLRDCALRLPPASVVGYNRVEGWIRLDGIIRRRSPQWSGTVALVRDGQTTGELLSERVDHLDYYIHQPGYGPGTPALMTGPVVCRTKQSTVYRVRG
jgi:hypothetical protein